MEIYRHHLLDEVGDTETLQQIEEACVNARARQLAEVVGDLFWPFSAVHLHSGVLSLLRRSVYSKSHETFAF